MGVSLVEHFILLFQVKQKTLKAITVVKKSMVMENLNFLDDKSYYEHAGVNHLALQGGVIHNIFKLSLHLVNLIN